MKSNLKALQKRGFSTPQEIERFRHLSQQKLKALLSSPNAVERTISASLLIPNDPQIVNDLLQQLSKEVCLYPKIAICECLQKGNSLVAEQMIPYLGKIGSNQYKVAPKRSSSKKSYPLPRDIIARALGKMEHAVLPLAKALEEKDEAIVSEALDAFGFLIFYHQKYAAQSNLSYILSIVNRFSENNLILWKALTCLSAFPLPESICVLQQYVSSDNILAEEAKRSLSLLQK